MGDRAMAEIKNGEGTLYFYTHWTGHSLPADAEEALAKARRRLGDEAYAMKIVIDSLINSSGARDSETGAGIMFEPIAEDQYNNDSPSVVIDLIKGEVSVTGRS